MSEIARRDVRGLAERVLRIEAEAILGVIPKLDERVERAVHMMRECTGRIVVTGIGKSGLVGRKIAATLASTGTPAYFLHPAEGMHGDVGMLTRGDVVLALSNSGETNEMLAILPPLKRLGVPIVLLTGWADKLDPAQVPNVDVVLGKPFTREKLFDTVARAVPERVRPA